MHELSIVMSIIRIAETESAKNNAIKVEEIELDIGALSGIEMTAFDFAWQQAVRATLLEHSKRKINHIPGEGQCMDCAALFPMQQLYEPCPVCGEHFVSVQKGKELRVKSLVVN
ncbi:MAG: hydrogenase maturation nickel metallochaperone HypA [Sphingobacteriales bacterium]|nr:hydrogenase maturation nickel metallochaperone HypA [Sphingobacteriales bacterium]